MYTEIRKLLSTEAGRTELKQLLHDFSGHLDAPGNRDLTRDQTLELVETIIRTTPSDSRVDGEADTNGCQLRYIECSQDDGYEIDSWVHETFDSPKAALHALWRHVQRAIMIRARDEFFARFESTIHRYNFFSVSSDATPERASYALLALNWEDASAVIDWYFDFARKQGKTADYTFSNSDGTAIDIDEIYAAHGMEHPMLDQVGISIIRKDTDDGVVYGARKSDGCEYGAYYGSHTGAIFVATTHLLCSINEQLGLRPADLVAMRQNDLLEKLKTVKP